MFTQPQSGKWARFAAANDEKAQSDHHDAEKSKFIEAALQQIAPSGTYHSSKTDRFIKLTLLPEQYDFYVDLQIAIAEKIQEEADRPRLLVEFIGYRRQAQMQHDAKLKLQTGYDIGLLGGTGPLSDAALIGVLMNQISPRDAKITLAMQRESLREQAKDMSVLLFSFPPPREVLALRHAQAYHSDATECSKENYCARYSLLSNTAHLNVSVASLFYDGLAQRMVNMVQEIADELAATASDSTRVLILGTKDAHDRKLYPDLLDQREIAWQLPMDSEPDEKQYLQDLIDKIKKGLGDKPNDVRCIVTQKNTSANKALVEMMFQLLHNAHKANKPFTDIILGCTEIPLALHAVDPDSNKSYLSLLIDKLRQAAVPVPTIIDSEQKFAASIRSSIADRQQAIAELPSVFNQIKNIRLACEADFCEFVAINIRQMQRLKDYPRVSAYYLEQVVALSKQQQRQASSPSSQHEPSDEKVASPESMGARSSVLTSKILQHCVHLYKLAAQTPEVMENVHILVNSIIRSVVDKEPNHQIQRSFYLQLMRGIMSDAKDVPENMQNLFRQHLLSLEAASLAQHLVLVRDNPPKIKCAILTLLIENTQYQLNKASAISSGTNDQRERRISGLLKAISAVSNAKREGELYFNITEFLSNDLTNSMQEMAQKIVSLIPADKKSGMLHGVVRAYALRSLDQAISYQRDKKPDPLKSDIRQQRISMLAVLKNSISGASNAKEVEILIRYFIKRPGVTTNMRGVHVDLLHKISEAKQILKCQHNVSSSQMSSSRFQPYR